MLLIRRRRPIGDPAAATPTSPAGAAASEGPLTLDGTAGAGRIVQALAELGAPLDVVVQLVLDPDAGSGTLDGVDIGVRFERVVLGSHLVNLVEDDRRRVFLRLARRHLAPDGTLLVEHHPIDWAETAEPTRAVPGGSQPGMIDVRRDPPFVSATSTYDVGGRVVRQPFTARVLADAELAAELRAVGLVFGPRLSPTWLAATTAGSPRPPA